MSALNAFVTADAVHLFTDGAVYLTGDSTVVGWMTKVFNLPAFDAVVGFVGTPQSALLSVAAAADVRATDFDGFMDVFGGKLKTAAAQARRGGQPFMESCELVVAGWSKSKDELQAHAIAGFSDNGRPAFEMRPVTKFLRPYGGSLVGVAFDPACPSESGLAIMEEQRCSKWKPHGAWTDIHAVGGFCQHTILTRDEVTTRVIRRWPDVVGEKIDLARAA